MIWGGRERGTYARHLQDHQIRQAGRILGQCRLEVRGEDGNIDEVLRAIKGEEEEVEGRGRHCPVGGGGRSSSRIRLDA